MEKSKKENKKIQNFCDNNNDKDKLLTEQENINNDYG